MKTLIVIPAYKVTEQILKTVDASLAFADHVLVVDDACPNGSGQLVEEEFSNTSNVSVLFHSENQGVGGAMKTGFNWAISRGYEVVVKVDGDGQINPELVPSLIAPLLQGEAEFAKGNRFDSPRTLRQMPKIRLFGNGILSLASKISTGYWSVNDPTNGFVAILTKTLDRLEPNLLSNGYFFESDLLYRLSTIRARIAELPMTAIYGSETSNLSITRAAFIFPALHARNLVKRIAYNYFLREMSIGSIELPVGLLLASTGIWYGLDTFSEAQAAGTNVTSGEAVATAIAIILGFQLLFSFVSHDIQREPK